MTTKMIGTKTAKRSKKQIASQTGERRDNGYKSCNEIGNTRVEEQDELKVEVMTILKRGK